MGKGKLWSAEELNFLREKWGSMSLQAIAKKLGRSENAVKLKVVRNGLGAFLENGEYITFRQITKAIGIDYGKKERLLRYGFPIKYRRVNENKFAVVYIDDFWIWAEQHKEMIDFSRIPVNILGKEPEWVQGARTAGYAHRTRSSPWTAADDTLLRQMLERNKYYLDDIAEALHRTEGAVKRRMVDLKLIHRPLRHQNKRWTNEEIIEMLTLRAAGNDWSVIGKKLDRSGSCCRAKFEMLVNPYFTKRDTRNSKEKLRNCFQKEMCNHWHKATGCDVSGTDCDTCEHFLRKDPSSAQNTGWQSATQCVMAAELLKKIQGGDWNG